jgi:hypothetical protein
MKLSILSMWASAAMVLMAIQSIESKQQQSSSSINQVRAEMSSDDAIRTIDFSRIRMPLTAFSKDQVQVTLTNTCPVGINVKSQIGTFRSVSNRSFLKIFFRWFQIMNGFFMVNLLELTLRIDNTNNNSSLINRKMTTTTIAMQQQSFDPQMLIFQFNHVKSLARQRKSKQQKHKAALIDSSHSWQAQTTQHKHSIGELLQMM